MPISDALKTLAAKHMLKPNEPLRIVVVPETTPGLAPESARRLSQAAWAASPWARFSRAVMRHLRKTKLHSVGWIVLALLIGCCVNSWGKQQEPGRHSSLARTTGTPEELVARVSVGLLNGIFASSCVSETARSPEPSPPMVLRRGRSCRLHHSDSGECSSRRRRPTAGRGGTERRRNAPTHRAGSPRHQAGLRSCHTI